LHKNVPRYAKFIASNGESLSHMDIQTSLLRQLDNPNLTLDGKAELRCQLAREYEEKGDYEAARQSMGELWQRIGERPKIDGLERSTAGEVLLRAGVLTGWIGSKHKITHAQETAKNLISESISIFESRRAVKKILEAQTEIAYCYWREGSYNEARIILKEALSRLTIANELKAKAILRSAIVERSALCYADALRILMDNAPLFEKITNHTIRGGYHNELGLVLKNLAAAEKREDYIDRAFVEYEAAGFHFEEAKHKPYRANVENNLGFLYFKVGNFKRAHHHLDRARRLLVSLKDSGTVAQVDETRARVFLAEGRHAEAEKAARWAVCTFEKCGRQSLLAEALITHGIALARLTYYTQSLSAFLRTIEIAEQMGTVNRAAEDALMMVRELGKHLASDEQAMMLGDALGESRLLYEHNLIKQALIRAEGSITHAARLLGITHQSLGYMLKTRHKDLISARTPAKQRRKSK
jgi:tetratricopeptide (TPR) repeat protein